MKVSRERSAVMRRELLDATATEVHRVGFDATALTAVAARCNVATSAIYNRFASRLELVRTLVEERLEPRLGATLDARQREFWELGEARTTLDRFQTEVLFELNLAASHDADLRAITTAFIERRVRAGLDARARAEAHGLVRDGQDPITQVLAPLAFDIGSYTLGLTSALPTSGFRSVDHLIAVSLRTVDPATPAPVDDPADRRVDPGPSASLLDLDELGVALVEAAADVFTERGYHNATVADIARRAGLTTGAIYNRFNGKADLASETLLRMISPPALNDMMDLSAAVARTSTTGESTDAILDVINRHSDQQSERTRALRIQARHAARSEVEVASVLGPIQDHMLASLADSFRRSQSAGSLRPDIDPEALAWQTCSLPLGIWLMQNSVPELTPKRWVPLVAQVFTSMQTFPSP